MQATSAKQEAFRRAMRKASNWWLIEHVDITCDLCEVEPIVGERLKCDVCEDVDLCGLCYASDDGNAHASGKHTFSPVEGAERAVRFLLPPKGLDIAAELQHQSNKMLDKYLSTFKPSQSSCEFIAWVCLSYCPSLEISDEELSVSDDECSGASPKGNITESATTTVDEENPSQSIAEGTISTEISNGQQSLMLEDRIDLLVEAFEAIEVGGSPVTSNLIDDFAAKFGVVRGKWMCFPESDAVDTVWEKLVRQMAAGELDPVSEIKVAPSSPGSQEHAICIYTEDYLDRTEVLLVRDMIRKVIPGLRMLYKPDIYTLLGIYRGNKWGLNASILVDPA